MNETQQKTMIGQACCPVCEGKARVSLSKKNWPVLTCQHCGIQLFVRGHKSDALIRARIVTEPAPAAAPTPEPQRNVTAAPAPARPVTAVPATTPATPTPAPRAAWGVMSWLK